MPPLHLHSARSVSTALSASPSCMPQHKILSNNSVSPCVLCQTQQVTMRDAVRKSLMASGWHKGHQRLQHLSWGCTAPACCSATLPGKGEENSGRSQWQAALQQYLHSSSCVQAMSAGVCGLSSPFICCFQAACQCQKVGHCTQSSLPRCRPANQSLLIIAWNVQNN